MRFWKLFLFCYLIFFFSIALVFADLSVSPESLNFEPQEGLVGHPVKIYLSVENTSAEDLRGVVKFYDEKELIHIGTDQSIAVVAGSKDLTFIEFTPQISGDHPIAAKVIPWDESKDNLENNKVIGTIFIDDDSDGDGIGNREDNDDDGDGHPDAEDVFPFNAVEWADTDGDGTGNNADVDDDNDGIEDVKDSFPLAPEEWEDLDQDGIGNNADTDDDGDSLSDDAEVTLGTDPNKFDTDGDGVGDGEDDYPIDGSKTYDIDKDGVPDEDDSDDDGDGKIDTVDAFPRDGNEWEDFDKDGIGDNADPDDDNDGLPDEREILKGTDPKDQDSDDDGFSDGEDEIPLDSLEHKDSDRDGLGDNADPNDFNQGPVLIVSASSDSIEKGETVNFDAGSSYDPDGGPLFYEWKFPDGSIRNKAAVDFTFNASGKKYVELTVSDSSGEPRTERLVILISRAKWEKWLWIFIVGVFFAAFVGTAPRKKDGGES